MEAKDTTIRPGLMLALAFAVLFFVARSTTVTAEHLKDSALDGHLRAAREAAARNPQESARQARLGLALNPGSFDARLELARALLATGNWQEAQGQLSQLRGADPTSSEVNLLSARASVEAGDTAGATDYYSRAVYGYWPPGESDRRLKARLEMVRLLSKQGNHDVLVPELLRLQREAPDDFPVRKEIAGLMLNAGMAQEAAAQYAALADAHPEDADLRLRQGDAELLLGRHVKAVSVLRTLVRLYPEDEQARSRLAFAEQVVSLNPLARGVSLRERYRRSQLLIDATLGQAETCNSAGVVAPQIDGIRRDAARAFRAATAEEDLDRNIETADRLWRMLPAACRVRNAEANPLTYVFDRIGKGDR